MAAIHFESQCLTIISQVMVNQLYVADFLISEFLNPLCGE